MANSRIYPQFFHTLVPSFHTHLIIPEDFFSEYIEGRSVAELKLDFSDKSWEVKLSDRRITDGWEEFVVANDFRIGDVVAFRYVGNLVFHVSNLGPNYYEIEHNDGESLLRKRLHQVDFSSNNGDVCDSEELPKEKKAKTNSEEADAVSSSSSADKSCFMAIITALDLTTDTLYLPLHFTSANGLTRKNREIILTDGGERSRVLDLRFDESSGTFYISRGWRNFCDENGQKAGGFFLFKLVGKGETLVLSFCPTESINGEENITREDSKDECSSLDSLMNIVEKKKYIPKPRGSPYSSYSPSHKQFVTFTLPPDYARIGKLSLSAPFVRENGINKPGEICLLDKHGRKWLTSLLLDSKGTMSLGKGWKEFVKANSLETGFTLKLIWEETTPVLSLCSPESNSDREQEEISKAIEKHSLFIDPSNRDKISNNDKEENMSWERKKDHLKSRDSTLSSQKQFVTITITPSSDRLRLPKVFTRENGINKPGRITLLGKDGIKQQTNLLFDKANGAMSLGHGWKDFVKDNGLKTGDSFTLKLIWEDQTPVLSLCPADCSIDREAGGGRSETNQKKSLPIEPSTCKKIRKDVNIKDDNSKEKNDKEESKSVDGERKYLRGTYLTPSSQKHFVTLTITPSSIKKDRLILSPQFARKNNIDKPGMIYLLDTDGTKWLISLQRDKKGTMSLGKGWKEFAEANDFKLGESFTMELVWEDTTPMLSLLRTEFRSSKANEKESISSEHKTRESSPTIKNRIVTPALTPEDVKACKLILPSQFMKKIRTVDKERNHLKGRDLNPSCQKQFVTFTITPTCVGKNRLILSAQFARENNINQPGTIYLLDTDGRKWLTTVKRDKKGTMSLGKGWKEFADTKDLKSGDSFTMELIWEDTNPVLSLLRTKFSSSKSNKEESIFLEPKSRDSSSPTIVNRFVTLALTPEDVTACKLILPSQFMKANGINNKLGKITLLGENGVEWPGYMLSLDGTLALGNGWEGFCEANGVKLGQTFTLEFVNEQDTTTTPVLKFSSVETIYKNVN